ncbi:hypothetical protein TgHK011_000692 [Trichoderma gracile]|nr:hypothetical protein TgHK011_000692 [Trichoderma gracile]
MEWSGAAFSSRRGHGAKWHHLPSPEQLLQPISGAQTEARPSLSTTAVCHATFAVRASGFTGAAATQQLLPALPER